MKNEITFDEWLSELERVQCNNGDAGMTVQELSDETGRTVEWVRKRIKEATKLSRIMVSHKRTTAIDGRLITVPAYRFVKGKK